MSVGSMAIHQPTMFLLVVKMDVATGFYVREGVCAVALERWRELESIADFETRDVLIS